MMAALDGATILDRYNLVILQKKTVTYYLCSYIIMVRYKSIFGYSIYSRGLQPERRRYYQRKRHIASTHSFEGVVYRLGPLIKIILNMGLKKN